MSEDGNSSAVKDNMNYHPHNITIKSIDFGQNHEKNLENLLTENDAFFCLNKSEKIEFKKEFIEKSGNKRFSDQNQNNEIMEVEKHRMRLTPSFFNNQQQTVNYIILIRINDIIFKENWFFYFYVKKKNTQYKRESR